MSDTVNITVAEGTVIRPGDTVIVSFKDGVTRELANRLADKFAEVARDAKLIVVSGAEMVVVRQ